MIFDESLNVAQEAEIKESNINGAADSVEKSEETIKPAFTMPKLYLGRRRYTMKDGRQFWEYILPAVFCGSRMEVHFIAGDVSGYKALDNIFATGVKQVELGITESKMLIESTKEMRKYNTYEAIYTDADGFIWRFLLKVKSPSDKAYMDNYIRYLRFAVEKNNK